MVIKTTQWSPDTCACIIEYTWDDSQPEDTRTHNLSRVLFRCPAHEAMPTNAAVNSALIRENTQVKNPALRHIIDNGPTAMIDVDTNGVRQFKRGITASLSWSGTAPNRVLNVTVTGITLTNQQKNTIRNMLNTRIGAGSVVLQ